MRVATSRCHYVGLRRVQQRDAHAMSQRGRAMCVFTTNISLDLGLDSGVEAEPAAAVFNTHTN